MALTYKFKTKLWFYGGKAGWFFATLPPDYAKEIDEIVNPLAKKGFGSLKVAATCRGVKWDTSIFPDKKSSSYLLPVKRDVRNKVGVSEGDTLDITLKLIDIT